MIVGTGIDVIEILRIEKAVASDSFTRRVFTAAERRYCEGKGARKAASYAARFAGKEAVLKAFGTGLAGGALQEIEILSDAQGRPRVALYGRFAALAEQMGVTDIFISLTHAQAYAAAQAIFWGGMNK